MFLFIYPDTQCIVSFQQHAIPSVYTVFLFHMKMVVDVAVIIVAVALKCKLFKELHAHEVLLQSFWGKQYTEALLRFILK